MKSQKYHKLFDKNLQYYKDKFIGIKGKDIGNEKVYNDIDEVIKAGSDTKIKKSTLLHIYRTI